MTSLRGHIVPGRDCTADSNADGDNVAPISHRQQHHHHHLLHATTSPSCGCRPTDIDDLHSYELLYKKMMNLFREILLMFLVCIVYTVLTHDFSPPKIARGPAAFPFFAKDSPVSDWYRGDVSAAVAFAGASDVVFVMFYAPWDAESQEIRGDFEKAARFFQGRVDFTAVNCWQPGSECRQKYSKVLKFPVLLAYTSDGRAIQYHGPKKTVHMIAFLNNLITPYQRVHSTDDILNMLVENDVVILASVDCRPNSKSFAVAYNVALKLIEKNPLREFGFAITTSPTEAPYLQVHLWNETLTYPTENAFRTRALLQWLADHMHQITKWMAPPGYKTGLLATYMTGPTMILFTPLNPLMKQMDHYIALKQAALEYYSCNETVLALKQERIISQRLKLRNTLSQTLARCNIYEKLQHPSISYTPNVFLNKSNANACRTSQSFAWETPQCADMPNQCVKHCLVDIPPPPSSQQQASPCPDGDSFTTSLHFTQRDRYTAKNLLKLRDEWQCALAQLAKQYHPIYVADFNASGVSIEGLACRGNATLSMLAMDSLVYHHFAESLGVDVLKAKRKTALVIVNPKDETHAILDGAFSDRSVREFVLNFTASNLRRALVDGSQEFSATHRFAQSACRKGDVCVPDLNSKNFMRTIMNPTKVVIVLYHSLQCAFCSGVSYMFLESARILANVSSIQFVRIDGDRNTLPWEYTMEKYPFILLFPALQKSESRAYPETMPITLTNLISFILANLDSSIKLQAMWEICYYSNHELDRSQCVSIVRRQNLALIEATLRQWRSAAPRHRQRILRKLQLLKTIHMNLAMEAAATRRAPHVVGGRLDTLSRASLRGVLQRFVDGQFRSLRDDL